MLVTTVGTVRPLGRPGRCGGHHGRAPTTSTRPASRPSSARSSSATGRRPTRPASGCSPRSATTGCRATWPAASRSSAPASWPRAWTWATSSPASGGSMSGGTKASLVGAISEPAFGFRDGRVQTERGAKRVRSFQVGSKQLPGRLGGQLGALRAAARGAAPARGERLPRLVRTGFARDAGDVGRHVGRDEGAGRGQALERRG